MRLFPALILTLILALPITGCGGTTSDGVSASNSQLVLMRPYRDSTDKCQLIGNSPAVQKFHDDHADLVGCPVRYEGTQAFESQTGAIRLGAQQGYVLFTILR